MALDVHSFKPVHGTVIDVTFPDGCERRVDLLDAVRAEGTFAEIRKPGFVASGRVNAETGTIEWPSGGDVSPERLYESGKQLKPANRVA